MYITQCRCQFERTLGQACLLILDPGRQEAAGTPPGHGDAGTLENLLCHDNSSIGRHHLEFSQPVRARGLAPPTSGPAATLCLYGSNIQSRGRPTLGYSSLHKAQPQNQVGQGPSPPASTPTVVSLATREGHTAHIGTTWSTELCGQKGACWAHRTSAT